MVYRPSLSENWILPALLLVLGALLLTTDRPETPTISLAVFACAVAFWPLVFISTSLTIHRHTKDVECRFLGWKRQVAIDRIRRIEWRGQFVFLRDRFPALDVYRDDGTLALTINLKPYRQKTITQFLMELSR